MTPTQFKERRNMLGLTQVKLAEDLGVTRQTIGLIEKGKRNPSKTLVKLFMTLKGNKK